MHAPPVVDEDVEDGEESDKEACTPLGLESDGDHDAGDKTDERDDDTGKCPVALEDESNEQEDEEDTASELNATCQGYFKRVLTTCDGQSR